MAVTAKRREQIKAWDNEHMRYQTVKVWAELLDAFRAACAERGDKVNTVLRQAMERYVAGDDSSDARNVTLSLDDVIAVCAILDSLNLGDTREDRFVAQIRDKLNQLRNAAMERAQMMDNNQAE